MTLATEPAGTAPAGERRIALSQSETESLCMKAARGAGFSWGLAEEAGVAVGWLHFHGIDGTARLLSLLTDRLANPSSSGRPVPTSGHWQCDGDSPLCPITTGSALLDSALLADGPAGRTTKIDPVAAPILLLPFLSRAAKLRAQPLEVEWPGGQFRIASDGKVDRQSALAWTGLTETDMTLRSPAQSVPRGSEPSSLPSLSPEVIDGLNALAMRTTVPATDASRRGAGSASTDND